jgi:hypothetical protein
MSAIQRSFSQRPSSNVQMMPIWAAAFTQRSGRPLILPASGGGPLFLWDPAQNEIACDLHQGPPAMSVIAVPGHSGELLCWDDSHGDLHLPSESDGVSKRFTAHECGIEAITACMSGSETLVMRLRLAAARRPTARAARDRPAMEIPAVTDSLPS